MNDDKKSFKELISENKDFKELKSNKYNPHETPSNRDSTNNIKSTEQSSKKIDTKLDTKQEINNLSDHLWRPQVKADDILFYFQHGVQYRTIRKLRSGKIRIEASLDLHQKNKEQASQLFYDFIKSSYENEYRCICIIHGKGYRGTNEHPILKNLINHWLHEIDEVLGFCSCPQNMGGTGAVLILLKRIL